MTMDSIDKNLVESLPKREILHFTYAYNQDAIDSLVADGYSESEWNEQMYVKKEYNPAYSTQVPIEYLGKEPNFSQSIHNHRYETHYFEVHKNDFEKMAVKPTLSKQCRPARYHNFDGFVELIQEEKKGLGWLEQTSDWHTTKTFVYFIVD